MALKHCLKNRPCDYRLLKFHNKFVPLSLEIK